MGKQGCMLGLMSDNTEIFFNFTLKAMQCLDSDHSIYYILCSDLNRLDSIVAFISFIYLFFFFFFWEGGGKTLIGYLGYAFNYINTQYISTKYAF